ncbi:NBS-LRR type resistance protein [Cucumis melo var. makuwa]|uniref:NBS-LRR type resistance protein n=1 Tax=Cucumis melo var. makuwa TaxID=1194695 RepID=A0A5A7USB8_CUCMM|nr:NBS-LRR type resistance protein [Cucumis melo var. makuwa]
MDKQTNDLVQAVRQDAEGLKDLIESGKKVSEEQGSRRRLEFMEERLRSIEGADMYENIDATQLCLISDVVIPPKFKTLDFEKYNGTTLVGPDFSLVHAIGWFTSALGPYYDRMVGSASTNFSDVIKIGERIEFGVKNGRITDLALKTRRKMTPKKKEGEVHELSSTQRVATHASSPTVRQTNYSHSYQNGGQSPFGQSTQRNTRNNWKQTRFDPIPMSYTELLPQLLKSHQVAIVPQEPLQPPYPKWGTLHKQSIGFVERTHQSRDPEGCTYQSSDPEGYTYQFSDPKGYTYQSSDPEGYTYQSSGPEGCTYQLEEGGSDRVSFKPGQPRATGLRTLDGSGVSRLGEVQRSALFERGGRPTEGTHDSENKRTVTTVALAGYEVEIRRADGETERKQRDWRRGDDDEKLQRTMAAGFPDAYCWCTRCSILDVLREEAVHSRGARCPCFLILQFCGPVT